MKKLVITIMAIIGVAVAYADNTAGSFLTFERADGSTTSVAVGSGITLNISNGSMTVGDETISVADLNKMFFTVQASIGEMGWATFCSPQPLDFTTVSGLIAYQAQFNTSAGSVSISELTAAVPAATGILLKGNEGNYYVPIATSSEEPTANELIGTTSAITSNGTFYALAKVNTTEVGFCLVGNGTDIPANKAYYAAPSNACARYIINSTETAIESALTDIDSHIDSFYDLRGQKVAKPTKGVYVIKKDGKTRKIVVK